MFVQRAAILLAGAATLSLFAPAVSAQVADDAVLSILRECARIDDPTARLGCYDNNIRSAGGTVRNTVPGEVRVQGGGSAPLANSGSTGTTGASGFGREDVRTEARFQPRPGELQELRARVTAVRQLGVGRYQLTLSDGAVWRFTDTVRQTYSVPGEGDEVEIGRASLGSFLLRYRGQQGVRVERVQ